MLRIWEAGKASNRELLEEQDGEVACNQIKADLRARKEVTTHDLSSFILFVIAE